MKSIVKKISILLPDLRPGGAEKMRVNMACEWIKQGYNVDFVLLNASGALLERVPVGANVINLKSSRLRSTVRPLIAYLKKSKPDVLLAAMWPLTVVAILSARLSKVKVNVLVSDHSILSLSYENYGKLHHLFLRASIAFFYRFADERIAVSKGVTQDRKSVV